MKFEFFGGWIMRVEGKEQDGLGGICVSQLRVNRGVDDIT